MTDSRTIVVTLQNLTQVETTCTAIMLPSPTNAAFQLSATELSFKPHETKTMSIKFRPSAKGALKATLVFASVLGDVHKVSLKGHGGNAIKVHETSLNFGSTDISLNGSIRRIVIENMDSSRSVPVSFSTSSREIVVNDNEPLLLKPREKCKVAVEFTAATTGDRVEYLYLSTPNSILPPIPIHAFSGPTVTVPVNEEVILPLTQVKSPVSVLVPIINHRDDPIQVLVTLPIKTPFIIRVKDLEFSSNKGENRLVEQKAFDSGEVTGFLVNMTAVMTATLEIVFMSYSPGSFRVPLKIQLIKPRKMEITTLYLNAVAQKAEQLGLDVAEVESATEFLRAPNQVEPKGALAVFAGERSAEPTVLVTKISNVFDVRPRRLTFLANAARSLSSHEIVSVVNASDKPQKYRILLSAPFSTDAPLQGIVGPYGKVDVVIKFNFDLFEAAKECPERITYGTFCVFEEDTPINPGLISIPIYGIIGEALHMNVRNSVDTLTVPPTALNHKTSRYLKLYNKLPVPVDAEARMLLQRSADAPVTSDPQLIGPFSIPLPNIVLKPFECYKFEISCLAYTPAIYLARVDFEYADPSRSSDEEVQIKRSAGQLEFECAAGTLEVVPLSDMVVMTRKQKTQSFAGSVDVLTYAHVDKLNFTMSVDHAYQLASFSDQVHMNKPKKMLVRYQPTFNGLYESFLSLAYQSITRSLALLPETDTWSITTNRGTPRLVASTDSVPTILLNDAIDFGYLSPGKPKVLPLIICNQGGSACSITQIRSKNEGNLKWKPNIEFLKSLEQCQHEEKLHNFGRDKLDDLEADWDEMDFQFKQIVGAKSNMRPLLLLQRLGSQLSSRKVPASSESADSQALLNAIFPIRLQPLQSLEISLELFGSKVGDILCSLEFDVRFPSGAIHTYQMGTKAIVDVPLHVWDRRIDFGMKPMQTKHVSEFKFTNNTSRIVPWEIATTAIKCEPIIRARSENKKSADLVVNQKNQPRHVTSPIEIYPLNGHLEPGCTQSVEVVFKPGLANYRLEKTLKLITKDGELSETPLYVHGIGATGSLTCDTDALDFKVVRVGVEKIMTLKIRNTGLLPSRYFIESSNKVFSTGSEQGVLEGGKEMKLNIQCCLQSKQLYEGFLRITTQTADSSFGNTLVVNMKAKGSYPELFINTHDINFGCVIVKKANKKSIIVENKGDAEANLIFHCAHPHVQLEIPDDKTLCVPPCSSIEVLVTYTPQKVEAFESNVFIRSSDSRGDFMMVRLSGSVGVHQIVTNPPNLSEFMNFGICRIYGSYTRTFVLQNKGNMGIYWTAKITPQIPKNYQGDAVFQISPNSGQVDRGQSQTISITFNPKQLVPFQHLLTITYDLFELEATLTGHGGRCVPKMEAPIQVVDFSTCRVGHVYTKTLALRNIGNLDGDYHVRPEPEDKAWNAYDQEIQLFRRKHLDLGERNEVKENIEPDMDKDEDVIEHAWIDRLEKIGFKILNPDGLLKTQGRVELKFQYLPTTESYSRTRIRLIFDDSYEELELCGRGAEPKLKLVDSNNVVLGKSAGGLDVLDLGVFALNSVYHYNVRLVNDGPFGMDFFLQPTGVEDFSVTPSRGFVQPNSSLPLQISFQPTSETKVSVVLKILSEKAPISLRVIGAGGIGRFRVLYADEQDASLKMINFGMIPFQATMERRFCIVNNSPVAAKMEYHIDNDEFEVAVVGEPFDLGDAMKTAVDTRLAKNRKPTGSWRLTGKFMLFSGKGQEMIIRFKAISSAMMTGTLRVQSETSKMLIPVQGRGGSVQLTHDGDLSFGDIASNFTYIRDVTLSNTGSIGTKMRYEWVIVGQPLSNGSDYVELVDNYLPADPRNGWARKTYLKEHGLSNNHQFTARDYWQLIKRIVIKSYIEDESDQPGSAKSGPGFGGLVGFISGKMNQTRSGNAPYVSERERRQTLYRLIEMQPLSNQVASTIKPFVRVTPSEQVVGSLSHISLKIEIHLGAESSFMGTLVCKSTLKDVAAYEIPVTANAKLISVFCNDTRKLDFGRQPIGEIETMVRTFKNVGHKDFYWNIHNENSMLSATPNYGLLKEGESVDIQFALKPVDESVQQSPIYFAPDCSQPIRLNFYGAGGHAKCSLSRYRRFDFGNCMINKDTLSYLPIVNDGNAFLHLAEFEISSSGTFLKGDKWPTGRLTLRPGQSFDLPLIFRPKDETPTPGKLIVKSRKDKWEIELIGSGREAVLVVAKSELDFNNCLIGNTYEQSVGFKNVGDVNYPITFQLTEPMDDIQFQPPTIIMSPFSQSQVNIVYTPTKPVSKTINLIISSPYSEHKVALAIHSGTATLEFNTHLLDFGLFEKRATPMMTFTMKNTGTIKTSYTVRDPNRPSMFALDNARGVLQPGKTATINVSQIRHEVGEFAEKLIVKSDVLGKEYYVDVKGVCEEAVIKVEELSLINMGTCAVMDTVTRQMKLTNYGKYPIFFELRYAFPIKAFPVRGMVEMGDTQEITVMWTPTGGYELRSSIKLCTNIGEFEVLVRGRSIYPDFTLNSTYYDFGVCGVGYEYTGKVTLNNVGKVALHWTIPTMTDGFSVTTDSGVLQPKQSDVIEVLFKPSGPSKFSTRCIVQAKGASFKEITLVGIGGELKMDDFPSTFRIGRVACELLRYHNIKFTNSGDVPLYITWKEESVDAIKEDLLSDLTTIKPPTPGPIICDIELPDALMIPPGQPASIPLGVRPRVEGHFKKTIYMVTKEKMIPIVVEGAGMRIKLNENMKNLVYQYLKSIGPLDAEETLSELEKMMRKVDKRISADVRIVDTLMEIHNKLTMMDEESLKLLNPTAKITELKPPSHEEIQAIAANVTDKTLSVDKKRSNLILDLKIAINQSKLDVGDIDKTINKVGGLFILQIVLKAIPLTLFYSLAYGIETIRVRSRDSTKTRTRRSHHRQGRTKGIPQSTRITCRRRIRSRRTIRLH